MQKKFFRKDKETAPKFSEENQGNHAPSARRPAAVGRPAAVVKNRNGTRYSPPSSFASKDHASSGVSRDHSRGGPSRGGPSQNQRRRSKPTSINVDIAEFIRKVRSTEKQPVYQPRHVFSDFEIVEPLMRNIIEKGYIAPTPIQDQAIPDILQGRDVVGIANTGTGKTAAFLIPLVNRVLANPKEKVLIIVPTRELAIQIETELRDFTKGMRLYSVICVGGANIVPQIRKLRSPYNFVVGTPGRLMDLIQRKVLNVNEIRNIVLDEADRMLDMGFIADIRSIMSQMPATRHTLFFSATMSPEIDRLIKTFLKDPIRISVKTRETAENVDQNIIPVPHHMKKLDMLHDLLIKPEFKKVLIFGRTKHGVEKLTEMLIERGFKADSMHGDKNQARRQRALALFREDEIQVLVATDVAARGLDIDGVSHVINYDMPATMEDYVHRIGRTGRGDMRGVAITLQDVAPSRKY